MLAIQILLSGITAGSIYAIVALGFVLIYKGTQVIHFGLGDQDDAGAYVGGAFFRHRVPTGDERGAGRMFSAGKIDAWAGFLRPPRAIGAAKAVGQCRK
jgi:branched-subunit amino acid ABC-type transport system permease component